MSLELSINGGYGKYAGKAYTNNINAGYGEYESTIIPISLRFRVSPFILKGWNPYFFVGGGIMNFNVNTNPNIVGADVEEDGWIATVPVGIGAEFALSERVLLDFGLGGAISSTYYLDGYRSLAEDVWDSYYNVSLGLTFTGENCKSDRDNDGLEICFEKEIGTDPNNPDTDGDGLNDGEEYLTLKTNPLHADSDSDGLNDYEEAKVRNTNPLISDTDNDGLLDGYEVVTSKTDPLIADTDKDGLNDAKEINIYKTNPLISDTDGDDLSDSEEVLKYKTNPLIRDTDEGSIDDDIEVKRGTDPLNPKDDVVRIGVPIVLEGITFATNEYSITLESETILMDALKTLQTNPKIIVEISGHTDNVGSNSYNQKLSEKRADAVKEWLVTNGISPDRITTFGYGEEHPRVPSDTEDNKKLNRRIEFKRIR